MTIWTKEGEINDDLYAPILVVTLLLSKQFYCERYSFRQKQTFEGIEWLNALVSLSPYQAYRHREVRQFDAWLEDSLSDISNRFMIGRSNAMKETGKGGGRSKVRVENKENCVMIGMPFSIRGCLINLGKLPYL